MPQNDMNETNGMEYESVSTPRQKRKKKKKRFTTADGIRLGVIVVALGVFVFALVKLLNIQETYQEAKDIYADIQGQVVADETFPDSTTANRLVSPSKKVNWDKLFEIQPNAVGYVDFPLLKIFLPIAQGEDNDYYLNHTFDNKESWSGSIFLDYRLSKNLREGHMVFYGHNMKDGSMFHDLLQYDSEDFFKKNVGKNYFFIHTPKEIRVYEIFSVGDVNIDDNTKAYSIDITDEFTAKDYAEYVTSVQLYETGVSIDDVTQVATLFTCQYDSQSNVRHMVHGKLVEIIEY